MTVDIDDLKKEEEEANEWDTNPVKLAIQKALQGPLNNENYRRKNPQQIAEDLKTAFDQEKNIKAQHILVMKRLLRKVARSKSTQEAIMIIGEYLLS